MSGASQHTPNNGQTIDGAMLQNNMYAWVADGLGRLDVSNAVDVTFAYDAITTKDKRRIANPLAHIQFAASLNAIRTMYSGYDLTAQTVRYTNNKYSDRHSLQLIDRNTTMGTYNTISGGVANDGKADKNIQMRKMLLKPVIDEFQLIPQLVADASGSNPYRMDLTFDGDTTDGDVDLSYVNFLYSNVEIAPGVNRAATSPDLDAARCVASGNSKGNTDTETLFHVIDMSNGGDTGENEDASYNIIAAFKIYSKYNHVGTGDANTTDGPTVQTWPAAVNGSDVIALSENYTVDGFPVTLRSRSNKEPTFNFTINDNGATGSGGGLEDCSYIVQVLYGDLTDMSFVNGIGGRLNQDCSFICTGSLMANTVGSTEVLTTRATLYSELPTQGVDLSFVAKTLSSTSVLENNSDSYLGDIMLPIVGIADICGGLQCVHVPDSLKNIRTDAAASLASNFAGLTELMGNISFTAADDVSAGEINVLAYNDMCGNAMDGSSNNDINGLFTISGDILSNKLRNIMLGGTISASSSTSFLNTTTEQHIHKVVYSSQGNVSTNPDVSNACLARDFDLSCVNPNQTTGLCNDITAANINSMKPSGYPHSASTATGGVTDVSCELAELTPQESAFFYLYPWASAQMCAIGSAVDDPYGFNGYSDAALAANDDTVLPGITSVFTADSPGVAGADVHNIKAGAITCNPFRHFQEKYIKVDGIDKGYSDTLELNSIKASVPTAEGWMDCSHGYYNVAKDRTEWYSFVDICYNNNFNAIQTNDSVYVYQDFASAATSTQGRFKFSILDIVFPDVSGLGLNDIVSDAQDDTDGANNDFCTLNFQVPLKGTTAEADKRFAKVNNLNAGQIQLANENYTLKSGFTAKCTARADNLTIISANISELMNAYMPVIVRIMDESTIGHPLEDSNGANVNLSKGTVAGDYGS